MIIDPGRRKEQHTPIYIGETEVERVRTFKLLGTCEDLTWSHNSHQLLKKAHQRLYFLKRLSKFGMSTKILSNVITNSITVWYGNCIAQDWKAVQRVIKTAQYIFGAAFTSLQDIYTTRVIRRAHNIIKDSTQPQQSLHSFAIRETLQKCEIEDKETIKQLLPTAHQTVEQ